MTPRSLAWEGCRNVRDLGGLPTRDGGTTRWGAVVRADHPSRLTAAGWRSVLDHGVRAVIELRTHGIVKDLPDRAARPGPITTAAFEIEDFTDPDFRQRWVETHLWCTPAYFRWALETWPERHARVVGAFAHAPEGGVLVHCERGCDRTGIVSLLLLALADVQLDAIVADYEASDASVAGAERETACAALTAAGLTVGDAIARALAGLDVAAYLVAGGLTPDTVRRARERLVGR